VTEFVKITVLMPWQPYVDNNYDSVQNEEG
jgi:hypothetical protein